LDISSFILTIIGTIASIAGAVYSYVQAKSAKTSAEIAKDAEKNIRQHRSTSEIAKIKEKTESLISEVNIYGHGGNINRYQVADHDKNAEKIQGLCLTINGLISSFTGKSKTEIAALSNDIEQELINFNNQNITDESRKASGRTILNKLSMLNSKLKSILDKKVESSA